MDRLMTSFFFRCISIVIIVLLYPLGDAYSLEPGESIVLDPVTGNYRLTYLDEQNDGSKILSHATFCPSTKIVPTLDSKFHLDQSGAVKYGYSVSSGAQSRQMLNFMSFNIVGRVAGSEDLPTDMRTSNVAQAFAVLATNEQALATPIGWRGAISSYEGGYSVSWDTVAMRSGIPPKGHLNGFGFSSQSLPGVGVAQFKGACKFVNGYGGEGPDPGSDIAKQIQALDDNDFIARNAAVPTIAVPTPFDATTLLERIQSHMHTWINNQLLDATFSSKLDRSFQSAISAYRLNQPEVGKQQIETMLALIKKEQQNLGQDEEYKGDNNLGKVDRYKSLIDRLAASVLDFDLRYVTKRIGSGD